MGQPSSARSPWASSMQDVDVLEIVPVQEPIRGAIHVPGSKSFTNRALIVAALAKGRSTLRGVLKSDDSYWCIDALQRLGVDIQVEDDVVHIQGANGQWPNREAELFIGAAGTIARFLPGALSVATEGSWVVDGIEQLRGRPLQPLIDSLRSLGAQIEYMTDHQGLPIRVHGHGLGGGHVQIPGNVSSQFLSGLLLAGPYARQPLELEVTEGLVQSDYIGITLQVMEQFGAEVSANAQRFVVRPSGYQARATTLEADASTACYFLSLAALTGGTVRVENVGYHSLQPDARFIDVLERMGCHCVKDSSYLEVTGPAQLKGGFTVDMKPMSDQALTIGALAPFADAPIEVTNVPHIRKHESDRIAVLCQSLRKMGIEVEEYEDGFKVSPGQPQPATLDPHDDHRQAMAFALMGVKVAGVRILDPGCVSKTCPQYFSELRKLGVGVELRS